jgi:hypothetical protein
VSVVRVSCWRSSPHWCGGRSTSRGAGGHSGARRFLSVRECGKRVRVEQGAVQRAHGKAGRARGRVGVVCRKQKRSVSKHTKTKKQQRRSPSPSRSDHAGCSHAGFSIPPPSHREMSHHRSTLVCASASSCAAQSDTSKRALRLCVEACQLGTVRA